LQHPNKAANTLEADYHQRITMAFQLKDKSTNKVMLTHQAFIRLTNQNTKQEIFFVPEADSSKVYKFDLVSLVYYLLLVCTGRY
jgi:oligosaccharyltransferase complex subunit delta (ribophorin II)